MSSIVNVVLPVFAIILTGYLSGRRGLLGAASSQAFNGFVFYGKKMRHLCCAHLGGRFGFDGTQHTDANGTVRFVATELMTLKPFWLILRRLRSTCDP